MRHRGSACCYFPDAPGLPYGQKLRPRRMAIAERLLWWRWMDAHRHAFDLVWYDAHIPRDLGTLITPHCHDETHEQALMRCWQMATCLRADVIAMSGGTYTIIEIHLGATEDNYGRLLRYDWLARQHWPQLTWTNPILLTDRPPAVPIAHGGEWERIRVELGPDLVPMHG